MVIVQGKQADLESHFESVDAEPNRGHNEC